MPILIAVITLILVIAFAMGAEWNAADESTLYVLIGVVVALFLVLFFLPYLREFNRSESSRSRIRSFRKKGRVFALRFSAASIVIAGSLVWWLREVPQTVVTQTLTVPSASLETPPKSKAAPDPNMAAASETEITTFVADWAQHWSDGDVEKYLAAYSPEFVPTDGVSRKLWETQRRQRVDKGRNIVVKVAKISVETQAVGRAKVVFVQKYSARGLTDLSTKTLQLERMDGKWRIARETAVAITKSE